MVRIGGECNVCCENEAKYRCPKCRIVYCSVGCYKTHKEFTEYCIEDTSNEMLKILGDTSSHTYGDDDDDDDDIKEKDSKTHELLPRKNEFDAVNPNDWYKSRGKFDRSWILKVVFVGKHMIVGNVPVCKAEWESRQEKCRSILEISGAPKQNPNSGFFAKWADVRDAVRCMRKKYEKEDDHIGFIKFLEEARALWREEKSLSKVNRVKRDLFGE